MIINQKRGLYFNVSIFIYHGAFNQTHEYVVNGRELQSIPASYPIETDIANVYSEIGRVVFDKIAKEYIRLKKLVSDVRGMDPKIGSQLETKIKEELDKIKERAISSHLKFIKML